MQGLAAVLLLAFAGNAHAQATAQSSIAPDLRECYNNASLVNRNNLPPATIPVLIDIIRKVEESNPNKDLREIAALLLHTYRQDGIEYHQPENNIIAASNVMPFAPTFHSFHRHRLLLTRMIPSNLLNLNNDTVSSELKCALHYMLSTTVDARLRGDESNCNQFAQYRALRTARDTQHNKYEDVEVLDESVLESKNKIGQMRQYNPNGDVEYTNNYGASYERQVIGESQCPILGGVVRSSWGALSAGHLLAGIAAGAQNQQIPFTELIRGGSSNYQTTQQTVTAIFPATLSGDLAEAVLIQGTAGNPSVSIGTAGNWNSSQATRHYMISNRINIEMTDPEIRGDIDGFVLGSTLSSTLSTYGSLKLSQLIDMYYSARNGVFNPALRACNRRDLSQQHITTTNLVSETLTFAAALDSNMPLRGTITGGLEELVNNAVSNFQSYTTSNLNDMPCVTTENTSDDFRLKTNLYLVVDASWPYQAVYPAISFVLDSIEVSKYGSSVTLLNSFDGNIVINKTFSLADFHTQYTLARHQTLMTGVNLQTSLTNIRNLMHNELQNERATNYVGGNATVLLFLLNTGNLQNNDQVLEQARILNETVPDLRILFATSTNQLDTLWNLVRDMHNDIKTVSLNNEGTNVDTVMNPVVNRIKEVGRRIINPSCGPDFPSGAQSGTRAFDDFVEPGYINFYSISPNYFYGDNENTRIRITRTAGGVGTLVICQSRVVTQPRQNSTSIIGIDENAIQCQTLTSGNVEISLQNACDGYSTISSCPFFHISVQSAIQGNNTVLSASCTDNACRYPFNIRYQVQTNELRCFSGAYGITASLTFVLSTLFHTVIKRH